MIIDTHAHYDDTEFDEDRDTLINSFKDHGIELAINSGATMETSRSGLRLSHIYDNLFCALGVHPNETAGLTDSDMDWIVENSADPKVVAVGEIGLDYHFPEPTCEVQKLWFAKQINAAKRAGLPVLVHSRDAARDTFELMKAEHAEETGGVIHCFSYGPELAKEYLKMGFYIGVGGVVTFKNAKKMKETVKSIPLSSILLETDSPYLSPEPLRGTRNSSLNLKYVVKAIAEIKETDENEVIAVTHDNALRLFPKMNTERTCRH